MNPILFGYIIRFLKWLKGSFDVSEVGASAKKLTVFAFVFLVFYLHFNFCDKENVFEFLVTDVTLIGTILGVATLDKIQSRNQKNKDNPNNENDGQL